MLKSGFDLDVLARELAAGQGHSWHEMSAFPGYKRNIWREAARDLLTRRMPHAIVEALPPECDGREGGWVVHLP